VNELKNEVYDILSNFSHDIFTRFLPYHDHGDRPKEHDLEQDVRKDADDLVKQYVSTITAINSDQNHIKKLITELGEKILNPDREYRIKFYSKEDKEIDFYNTVNCYAKEIETLLSHNEMLNMNNHTYEQRKMIAEYLKNNLSNSMNSIDDSALIQSKIYELLDVTFGDIKNQVGTRFKCSVLCQGEEPIIIKHFNKNDYYVFFENDYSILNINDFSDHMEVEVIND